MVHVVLSETLLNRRTPKPLLEGISGKAKAMRKWEESLRERLADSPEYAAEYLNAVLEENDTQAFLLALRHVADANGGLSKLASDAVLSRESLYRTLSESGNPKLSSLTALLEALGMQLMVSPKKAA